MADFKTHSIVGAGTGIFLSCLAVMGNFITLSGSVLAVYLSLLASSLPDIDSSTGSPRQFVLAALEILGPALLIVSFANKLTLEDLLLAGIAVFFVLRFPVRSMIDKLTKHRGIWHSIPMAAAGALVIYLAFFQSAFSSRVFFALIFLVCFLSHLILDEICSLKYFGLSVKRSFGTAFKLTGTSRKQTVFIYTLIFILAGVCLFEHFSGGF